MSANDTEDGEFDFDVGDRVLVRVRADGTSGDIVAKFEAECRSIRQRPGRQHQEATLDVDWGLHNSVRLRWYEAEFEVLD